MTIYDYIAMTISHITMTKSPYRDDYIALSPWPYRHISTTISPYLHDYIAIYPWLYRNIATTISPYHHNYIAISPWLYRHISLTISPWLYCHIAMTISPYLYDHVSMTISPLLGRWLESQRWSRQSPSITELESWWRTMTIVVIVVEMKETSMTLTFFCGGNK